VGNCFLTNVVHIYVCVRVKWHYFIIDLKCSGFCFSMKHWGAESILRFTAYFVIKFIIYFLGRKF
jgi:hypothetical protein